MKASEKPKKSDGEEVLWDLIDRCLLPLIFSHAAAVIVTTFLNTLHISQISLFSVFTIFVSITLAVTLFYHNLKVSCAGKNIVLSGCETQMGFNIAKYLDDLGLTVFAGFSGEAKNKEKLRAECSGRLHTIDLDVTSEKSIQVALSYVTQHSGGAVWAVVNAACWSAFGESEWVPASVYRKTLEVNLLGNIALTRAFLPLTRKTKGRVINITSICGRITSGIRAPLCIVSSALQSISECLRINLRPRGVDVIIIETGLTTTAAWYDNKIMLDEARKLWYSFTDEQRKEYGEKYFEYQITSMKEYSTKQEDMSVFLRTVGDAVTRTFPLTRYTPVSRKEKIQAFIAQHLPYSVYSIIYD